jgi:hypothetical protein
VSFVTGVVFVVAAVAAAASPAFAQVGASRPPGPFVVDIRGATMAVPDDPSFQPPAPGATLFPTRGFGGEVAAHVYVANVLGARLGLGGGALRIFASTSPPDPPDPTPGTTPPPRTVPDIRSTMTILAPQVSLNFGSRNGWSYVSAGYGTASLRMEASGIADEVVRASGRLPAINVGGGARWFRSDHLAFAFDIRVHIVGARPRAVPEVSTPRTMLMAASVGISLR